MNSYFFPDPSEFGKLVAFFCYLIILACSYRRFNALAVDYGTYDAPDKARPWTTWLRFHLSAVIYFSISAVLFAFMYKLFLEYPKLLEFFVESVKSEVLKKLFDSLNQESTMIGPIGALVLITWAVQKISKTRDWDLFIRRSLQRLGSIPIQVARTIGEMKRADLSMDTDEMIKDLPDEIKSEIILRAKQKDQKSFETLYLRACHLHLKISEWDEKSSKFYHYRTVYKRQYENIGRAFQKLRKETERYYHISFEFKSIRYLRDQLLNGREKKQIHPNEDLISNEYPKLLKDHKRDIKQELKDFLENIYTFIACAAHCERKTTKSRRKLLKEFGFSSPEYSTKPLDALDPNDLTILAILSIFIIPVAAAFCRIIGGSALIGKGYEIMAVWTPMAMFVGLCSAFSASVAKKCVVSSRCKFWECIKPGDGRPWCSYLVGGFMAALGTIFGLVFLSYLNPPERVTPFLGKLAQYWEWSLVALAIASITGYHLDNKAKNSKTVVFVETLTTGAAAVIAAAFALIIIKCQFTFEVIKEGFRFVFPAAALLGGCVGLIQPRRFRLHLKPSILLNKSKTNLRRVIEESVKNFKDRVNHEQINISLDVKNNIPTVNADELRIKQVIEGLLSNALEYTQEGGHIEIKANAKENGNLEVIVKDNGIGMKECHLKKLKESIETTKGVENGSLNGITKDRSANLRQIKSIIELHGGTLDFESSVKSGTAASVELPKELIVSSDPGDMSANIN
jgi:hypothetical protein